MSDTVKRNLLIRLGVVAVVLIACAILAIPPSEKIRLGLDLQGGLHLVLEVQAEQAVKRSLDRMADLLRQDLRARGLNVTAVEPDGVQGIRMVFGKPPDMAVVQEVAQQYVPEGVSQQSPEVVT